MQLIKDCLSSNIIQTLASEFLLGELNLVLVLFDEVTAIKNTAIMFIMSVQQIRKIIQDITLQPKYTKI